MKYLVLFNSDKGTKVLNEFSDKYNCLFFIENYVNSYLMSKQGDIDINKNISTLNIIKTIELLRIHK